MRAAPCSGGEFLDLEVSFCMRDRKHELCLQALHPSVWSPQSPCRDEFSRPLDKKLSLRADSTTTLLVGADSHQIHEIQSAIEELSSEGGRPSVMLFAAPERVDSKSWRRFLQKHHITFKPVERVGGCIDPNDESYSVACAPFAGGSWPETTGIVDC